MMPILIVDDSGEDATLARRVLEQCKIVNPVLLLKSGQECIAYFDRLGSHAAGTLPCLLLLDLSMQPTSGLDVLSHLRQSPHAKDSILVMLSGITDYNVVNQGYQLGATTFLVKPLRADDVLRMVKAVRGLMVRNTSEGYILAPQSSAEPRPLSEETAKDSFSA